MSLLRTTMLYTPRVTEWRTDGQNSSKLPLIQFKLFISASASPASFHFVSLSGSLLMTGLPTQPESGKCWMSGQWLFFIYYWILVEIAFSEIPSLPTWNENQSLERSKKEVQILTHRRIGVIIYPIRGTHSVAHSVIRKLSLIFWGFP